MIKNYSMQLKKVISRKWRSLLKVEEFRQMSIWTWRISNRTAMVKHLFGLLRLYGLYSFSSLFPFFICVLVVGRNFETVNNLWLEAKGPNCQILVGKRRRRQSRRTRSFRLSSLLGLCSMLFVVLFALCILVFTSIIARKSRTCPTFDRKRCRHRSSRQCGTSIPL